MGPAAHQDANDSGNKPQESKIHTDAGRRCPAITELLGGHVDAVVCSYPEIASQVEAKAVRTLAVFADERNPLFPEIPTLKEQGIDVSGGTWRGFCVPLKTPDYVVATLTDALKKVVSSQEFRNFMTKSQFGVKIRVGKDFGDFMNTEFASLKSVMKKPGI